MQIPAYLYGENESLQRYFALLVQLLQQGLSDNGFTIPGQSTANITMIRSFDFRPVMPAGTMWFNTDLMKMQFITIPANPNIPIPTNAVIETITSV